MRSRRAAVVLALLCLGVFVAAAHALTAGDLDTTYSADGKVTDPIGEGLRPGGRYDAIALQPDGKLVAAGASSSDGSLVVRIRPDGTLDPSFDADGKLLNPLAAGANEGMSIRSIAIAPSGKIVIAGYVQNYTTQVARAAVVRLTPEGALDTTFDGDGILVTQLGETATTFSNFYAADVLPDERILLAGNARDSAGHVATLLARRLPGGDPDPAFGTGGKTITQFGIGTNLSSGVAAMRRQPDGRIVIAGLATDTDNAQPDAALVARFDADGKALDPSFGTGGAYRGRLGTPGYPVHINGLRLQTDGKPVVVGTTGDNTKNSPTTEALVARLEADGSAVDAGFATNGNFHQPFEGAAGDASFRDVVIQPDGKIVAAGNGEDAGFTVLVARFTGGGALDPSFSGDGRDLTQLGGLSSAFGSVALQPDGKILAAGTALFSVNGNMDEHPLIARYVADVPPTASFTATPSPAAVGQDVAFDGRGSTDPEAAIATYEWAFGDGATAAGATVTHRYAAAGTYTATLTVHDAYGLTGSASQTITVKASGDGIPFGGVAPVVTGLAIKPGRFAAAPTGGSVARRTGATVSYTDSRKARTTFTVARVLPGRRAGKRCEAPARANRGARRCTRLVRLAGSFTRADVAGRNAFRFTGRLRRKTLPPERYHLTAKPKLGKTAGKPVSAGFQIVR